METNILISDLYEVKITSPKTQLKHNEQIPIFIQIVDFNGNNVNNKTVTLTTDNGSFIRSGGVVIGQGTTFTNDNNNAIIGFTMSQSGVANITVKVNNQIKNKLQIFTEDYKKIQLNTQHSSNTTYLYVNTNTRTCILPYQYNSTSLTKGEHIIEDTIIPSEYAPLGIIQTSIYRPDVATYIMNKSIYYRVESNKTLYANFNCTFNWIY